eukprot:403365969
MQSEKDFTNLVSSFKIYKTKFMLSALLLISSMTINMRGVGAQEFLTKSQEESFIRKDQDFNEIAANSEGIMGMFSERQLEVEYQFCKRDCIDKDYYYCPTANHMGGSCCAFSEKCTQYTVCSNDTLPDNPLRYWACANKAGCPQYDSGNIITPAMNGSTLTIQQTGNTIYDDNFCNYKIQFPENSTYGMVINFRVNKRDRAQVFYSIGESFSDVTATTGYAKKGQKYQAKYPQTVYLSIQGLQPFSADFNVYIWMTNGTLTNKPESQLIGEKIINNQKKLLVQIQERQETVAPNVTTQIFTATLDECKKMSKLFSNTCPDYYTDEILPVEEMQSADSECSSQKRKVKLCVTCRTDERTNFTLIRVQSNGIPSHCTSTMLDIKEVSIDYEVLFQPNLLQNGTDSLYTHRPYTTELYDQELVNSNLCDNYWPKQTSSLLPTNFTFRFVSSDESKNSLDFFDKVTGISLNGVFFINPNSEYKQDILIPPSGNWSYPLVIDECLGGNLDNLVYSYRTFSPCIYPPAALNQYVDFCQNNLLCFKREPTYMMQYFRENKRLQTLLVIGLAKDGRLIYGPFDENGKLWRACDLDMCNGKEINGHYSYVATPYYPYLVGCWGPSNNSTLQPTCTSNQRICLGFSNAQNLIIGVTTFFLTFLGLIFSY